jgi:transposase
MPRKQLTCREKREIIERYLNGDCLREIADNYDRSRQAIKNLVARYEIAPDGDLSRKTKLAKTQKRAILALVQNDPAIRLQEIHETLHLSVSLPTLGAYLKKEGFECEAAYKKSPHRVRTCINSR